VLKILAWFGNGVQQSRMTSQFANFCLNKIDYTTTI
jgi:hypothetical protein